MIQIIDTTHAVQVAVSELDITPHIGESIEVVLCDTHTGEETKTITGVIKNITHRIRLDRGFTSECYSTSTIITVV